MPNNAETRTFHELQPVIPLVEAWHWLLLVVIVSLFIGGSIWLYRRDTRTLARPTAFLLTLLRVFAIGMVVLFMLGLERRTESRSIKDSRVAVLVDTSLSMALTDKDEVGSESSGVNRFDQILDWLKKQDPISRLQQNHEVAVWKFDSDNRPWPVATFPKHSDGKKAGQSQLKVDQNERRSSFRFGVAATIAIALSIVLLVVGLFSQFRRKDAAPLLVASSLVLAVGGLLLLSICDLITPQLPLQGSLGWSDAKVQEPVEPVLLVEEEPPLTSVDFDWQKEIAPRGVESRLGAAIDFVVNRERAGSIAGIVVITDGQANGGKPTAIAVAAATNAGIPIYPIGIGSTVTPKNVEIVDLQVPPRVFPGDRFKVKAVVTAFGMEGTTAQVRLWSVDEKEKEAPIEEDADSFRISSDGEPTTISFDVQRSVEGKRRYIVSVDPLAEESDPDDNSGSAVVEIVERRTNVLLIAGGPTREYRFLRNQLFRDESITTHVWLQTAKPGADQESDVLLDSFPDTSEAMNFFDCVIAFDPNWSAMTADQTALFERWVAEQAGGMIVIAGPVNTPEWTRKPRGDQAIDALRKLYPVSFFSQGSSVLKIGRFGGDTAQPLDFTREGRAAEYLWLGDSAKQSTETWDGFSGVFGYYAVNEPKPGADVLANFSDPDTMVGDKLPIYLASQFYGAGRVFFQASGEMWRVRKLDVASFETYYNKLIRWSSQGRLLRDSTRGVLLVDKKRCWMGDTIAVRAILRNAQDQPLDSSQVSVTVFRPDETSDEIVLRTDGPAGRPGTFSGQFIASSEGDYRLTLSIPDSPELEVLNSRVSARIPDIERERPQRNDPLLSMMAEKTNGRYFVGVEAFTETPTDGGPALETMIQPRDQETFLSGSFDRLFKHKSMMWLLGLLVVALSIEWTVRRLHRLA